MCEAKTKTEGQVFTPQGIVTLILDSIGYKDKNTLIKNIIEPSFGEGVFLIEIVERIIQECKKQGKTNDEIVNIIKDNVFLIHRGDQLLKVNSFFEKR